MSISKKNDIVTIGKSQVEENYCIPNQILWGKEDEYISLQDFLFVSLPNIGIARIFQRGVTLCQSEGTRLFGHFQAETSWHFRHLF